MRLPILIVSVMAAIIVITVIIVLYLKFSKADGGAPLPTPQVTSPGVTILPYPLPPVPSTQPPVLTTPSPLPPPVFTPTPVVTPTPTPVPVVKPTPVPTPTQVPTPVVTPTPVPTPTPLPTPLPTSTVQQRYKPALNTSWQIQYAGEVNTALDVQMMDLDVYDTSAATIAKLHSLGKKVIGYISAGSYENWRDDAAKFPVAVLGKDMDGWPGEKWLDIRRIDVLRPIMEARMDMCKAKGFDGIDPDNVDGYANDSGFNLTYSDQIAYNRMLVEIAHARGLSIGLKNDLDQIADLVQYFDFAVNEQCFQYNECDTLMPFIKAGKPVFNVEYGLATTTFCPKANERNFNSLKKKLNLDAVRTPCRGV